MDNYLKSSQKVASDGAQNLALGPCIKNVTHDKYITAKLVMNSRCNFVQKLAILTNLRHFAQFCAKSHKCQC